MPLRERAYFGLDEIQARLKLTRRELLYLVENGLLKASVRVWDVVIEEGEYDQAAADGQTFRLPTDRRRFSGLRDLMPKDAYRLLRHQTGVISAFDAPGGQYLMLLHPENGIEVHVDDLIVRRDERDRFERTQRSSPPKLTRASSSSAAGWSTESPTSRCSKRRSCARAPTYRLPRR